MSYKADKTKIVGYLRRCTKSVFIDTVDSVPSTNDEIKLRAQNGENEITVLIAESQTKGKGTKGRSFFSPDGSGCYMSFLLRPAYSAEDCTLLTTAAAVAVAKAIDKFTDKQPQIKWVNDVYVDRKKVAGILTEASLDKSGRGLEYAVVGIGINLWEPCSGFPEEIKNIAASINLDKKLKNEFIAEIINVFTDYYDALPAREYLDEYRNRLFFLGEDIRVTRGDESFVARAVDIDSMCHLIVERDSGEIQTLFVGEITVRQTS